MNIPKNQPSPQRTVALRLEDIPPGREGWVYPIHAPSTNRYKIGRSVNPVFYFQEFTTQLLTFQHKRELDTLITNTFPKKFRLGMVARQRGQVGLRECHLTRFTTRAQSA